MMHSDMFTFAEVCHRGKNYYKTHFITDVVNGLNPRFLLTFQCDLQNENFHCLQSSQRITSRLCWPIMSEATRHIAQGVKIRYDEGLTLKTSAFDSLYGGYLTLFQLIWYWIKVFHSSTDIAAQF